MSDFPSSPPTPLFVNTMGLNSAFSAGRLIAATGGGGVLTWIANLAIYIPVMVPFAYSVKRAVWINGSTVTSTNVDFGIYDMAGTKLYSTGSTAMSGANAAQYVSASFLLSPGAYYFAWACDNTTNRAFGASPTASTIRLAGALQQASAFPLPATMTAATISNALYPFCGITRTASGF